LPASSHRPIRLQGSKDGFVTKIGLGSDGTSAWAIGIGGGLDDVVKSVATDSSKNVVVTGCFKSPTLVISGLSALTNNAVDDGFVAKLQGSDGVGLWSVGILGTNNEDVFGVALDSSENVLVVGSYGATSLAISGLSTLPYLGSTDGFVAKLQGSNGVGMWSVGFGGTGSEAAFSVAVDSSNDVIIGGKFTSSALTIAGNSAITNAGSSSNDGFVAKLDGSDGSGVWSAAVGGTTNDEVYGVAVDSSDNVVAVGTAAMMLLWPSSGAPMGSVCGRPG
jgi:hypothetical protein